MRLISIAAGLLMAAGLAVVPTSANADTGGGTVYFVRYDETTGAFRAPADNAAKRTALAVPAAGRGGSVSSVVPSPDGRWVAQVWTGIPLPHTPQTPRASRVIVTDRDGRHARTVWSRHVSSTRYRYVDWGVSGVSWADGPGKSTRLYFSASRYDDDLTTGESRTISRLVTSVVSAKGVPTTTKPVPGGDGLTSPTVDPTTGKLAAVRVQDSSCFEDTPGTATSTIVLLDPKTGAGRDLLTVTTPAADCALPIRQLAWSPDGKQIAFQQRSCCVAPHHLFSGEIDVVAVNGSDGDGYRVAVPFDGRYQVSAPAWRGPHSLWFQRQIEDDGAEDNGLRTVPDLYSVTYRHGDFGPLVRRTRTPKVYEYGPSFG